MSSICGIGKKALRSFLPRTIYLWMRQAYRLTRYSRTIPTWFRHGRPGITLLFGLAAGDDLLSTSVLHELRRRDGKNIWMSTSFPDIFTGNPDLDDIKPFDFWLLDYTRLLGGRAFQLSYSDLIEEEDRSNIPLRPIIAEMCKAIGMSGKIALRPYVYLTQEEKTHAAWAQGKIVIQSSGKAAKYPMQNKNWFAERYQEVVNSLVDKYDLIQIGASDDPPLLGALDLRGKTDRRGSAAILSQARLFIGQVGFVMHLARAVECPAVILYGGREAPWQSGYSCNFNLYSPLSCSPCWLWNRCDFDHKCMRQIEASHVIEQVENAMILSRENLIVDQYDLNGPLNQRYFNDQFLIEINL